MKKCPALNRIFFTVFLLLLTGLCKAQTLHDSSTIDVAGVKEFVEIYNAQIFVDMPGTATPASVLPAPWQPLSNFDSSKYIPNKWITKATYLKFRLANSDTITKKIYFIAGYYIRKIEILRVLPSGQLLKLKDETAFDGYQPIELPAKYEGVFIVKLFFTKRVYNSLEPTIIQAAYLNKYQVLKYFKNDGQPILGFILSGIMLMMIFFTGANYVQSKKKEFLYNCCYSICMFGLVFLNTFLEKKGGMLSSLFHEYLDFVLLLTGTVFYIAFTRKFLDTQSNYPVLDKIFVTVEKVLFLILAWFTFIVLFTNNFALQEMVKNGMKIMVLALGIVYIGSAFKQKNKLMLYLAIGNAILIFFSLISFTIILLHYKRSNIFTDAMAYYEVGVVCELVFFLIGLTYKNRIELIEKTKDGEALKLEAEKQLYESRLTVLNAQQDERNRISADMHDDLGAGVTAIRLYSELAKKRIGKDTVPEIEKISASANELLNNMNAIIWTMSSSNDSLDNMIAYIRSYALEYFEGTGINCQIKLAEDLPHIPVSGQLRRNIYMVVKEALNNILKHSKATQVTLTLNKEDGGLSLYIHDNGTGINFDKLRRFGNGLINMKKRMEAAQIIFTIENKNGTLIKLHRTLVRKVVHQTVHR